MKKTLFSIASTIGLFCALTINAQPLTPAVYGSEQTADVYQPYLSGGNTVIPAQSTNVIQTPGQTNTYSLPGVGPLAANTNLMIQSVSEFDYVGLTFGFTGTATSTNSLLIYKSFDKGRTFETVPSFQYLNIAPGANSFETNAVLDLHSVTTLAYVVYNTGTSPATNAAVKFNLKSAKWGLHEVTR